MPGKTKKDPKQKIIEAALILAAEKGWAKVSLAEIGRKAKISLRDMRGYFEDKTDILVALGRMIDKKVLEKLDNNSTDLSPRDRLFDILMERFEILNEYRDEINTSGIPGALRVAGLTGLYLDTLRIWKTDDSPDLGKTMAALDKHLSRAEKCSAMAGL